MQGESAESGNQGYPKWTLEPATAAQLIPSACVNTVSYISIQNKSKWPVISLLSAHRPRISITVINNPLPFFSTSHGAATIRFLVNGDGVTMQSVLLFRGLGKFLGQKYLAVRCLLFCENLILKTDHLQGILGAAGR